jgi:hypothetical protein
MLTLTVKKLADPQEAHANTDGYCVLADVGRGDQQAEADKQGHDGKWGHVFHASTMSRSMGPRQLAISTNTVVTWQ